MPRVEADFQDRKRVVFTARGRSSVNVRETIDDGPIGYNSTELLLISLGNCMLGTLLGHELLREADVRSAKATLDAEMATDPPRVASVVAHVTLDVADPALAARRAELEAATCGCPMCNSLNAQIHVTLDVRVAGEGRAAPK
jgi:uncharacterized OsmC-like protein